MLRRRSERCSERLDEMLSSLVSTNESIDKVCVGGYSLRRRKTLGGKEEEGGLTPAGPARTPATTRRSVRRTRNSLVTMTEPRPVSKGRNHETCENVTSFQLSPIKDTPPSPPPLNFDSANDDEDIINERIDSTDKEVVVENGSIVEENGGKGVPDHQVGDDEIDSVDQEMRDTDHDSDQRIETDDIDPDRLIGSVDSGHEADSNSDHSTGQEQQENESESLEFSQQTNDNVELKSKLKEELHRMKKMKGFYERNTERFPVEGLKSVAELLKLKKKKALAVQNKKMIKIKRKDKIPATMNSHVRKGCKVKVLLSYKDEDDSRITSAQQFRNDRLYNNSQYERESGYYALLRRSKIRM